MMNSEEIIILSDDDDDEDYDYDEDKENDLSCIVVEVNNKKKPGSESVSSPSIQDEDLVVTFSRRADVLPHARYDCPLVPFTPTDCETEAPVAGNKHFCEQCFCYICDKLASSCAVWCQSGLCHCNSHKRSDFWNNLRKAALLGELNDFNFTLSEIDSHLRDAGTMLQSFRKNLYALFSHLITEQTGHQQYKPTYAHDYKRLLEFVLWFLQEADRLDSRAAVVLHLGAAKEFNRLFHLLGPTRQLPTYEGVKAELLQKVMKTVHRHIVLGDSTPQFIHKLQDFYQKKVFLYEMKYLKNSSCIRLWDDVLLVSVLKGQNVSGYRMDKGKKDILTEQISVVQLRTELLQRQHRYQELCRYLRVVQTNDSRLFQQLRDLVPFFFCLLGNFSSAIMNLFPPANAPASHFTPQLFLVFLRIFQTATAPKLMVTHMEQLCSSSATWEPIEATEPMKCVNLVKFALRTQRFSASVLSDSQCWTSLFQIVNSSALPAPSQQFLHEAQAVVKSLLCEKVSNMPIPRTFLEVYPDQALLLLVTGALGEQILNASLSPALPVLSTFKENLWALQWLFESLAESKECFESFRQQITLEAANTTGSPLAAGWLHNPQQQPLPDAV